ncbi:SDR family NAD(P)-dependent oxidoreductase [Nitriliruptoraceae bacterium ZYF776]|nr:SDR family NAD(P)-dependent oxidoreductase [Profundirhabdus halotolerans]
MRRAYRAPPEPRRAGRQGSLPTTLPAGSRAGGAEVVARTDGAARGAVVTGGAGGLGRAIGQALAAQGLRVRLADVDADAAAAAAAELPAAAAGVRLDVTDASACAALADEVADTDGLAVWVNNAGVLPTGPAWTNGPAEVERAFAVNVHGLMHGTTAALARMRSRGGHIVNVVSLAGLVAAPGETVYAATKHAALAYTVGTALDLRHHRVRGVHLSAVCPDGIWTPMLHDKLDDPEAALSFSGGRTLLHPEQVAAAVADVLARPRLVVSVPRWRGGLARLYAATPGLARTVLPVVLADARRKQRRFAAKIRGGRA